MSASSLALADMSPLLMHQDALRIINILDESGFETRFVGGCVRDVLLGRVLGDIDLATTGTPDAVMAQLMRHQINVVPTGLAHGTVMAVINGQGYEITTLRHDIVTDGRHATVAFTDDWEQDARRRDFTINALSVDMDGVLYDYCGGIDDLHAQRLRFIDDAASRITEDYLRMLRLFRFASVLGWDIRDTELLELCSSLAPYMQQLSRERVQAEMYKLLGGAGCLPIVELMDQYDILVPWCHEIYPLALSETITREQCHGLKDEFRRLIALTGYRHADDGINDMVVLSRQQKKRLQDITAFIENDAGSWPQAKFCYYMGPQATEDCLVLFAPKGWTYKFLQEWKRPEFPLKAEYIMQETGGANALLGKILKEVESRWVDHDFIATLDDLLVHARILLRKEQGKDQSE